MSENYQSVEYTDELLADQSVSRVYSDGRREWRIRYADNTVHWRDHLGESGFDELLGEGIVKRTFNTVGKQPLYGREQGYGRTLWSDGFLTINQTSFGGRMGKTLAAVGGAALVGGLIAPPLIMSSGEEEALRQAEKQRQGDSGGGSSGGDSGDSDSSSETEAGGSWDEGGDFGDADGDFG